MGHFGSSTTLLLNKLSFVGREFLQARHIMCLIVLSTCILQIPLHKVLFPILVELSGWCAPSRYFTIWYALLTVKTPFLVPLHTNLFGCLVQLIGIDWIANLSVWLKISVNNSRFHPCTSWSINSFTFASTSKTLGGD